MNTVYPSISATVPYFVGFGLETSVADDRGRLSPTRQIQGLDPTCIDPFPHRGARAMYGKRGSNIPGAILLTSSRLILSDTPLTDLARASPPNIAWSHYVGPRCSVDAHYFSSPDVRKYSRDRPFCWLASHDPETPPVPSGPRKFLESSCRSCL